MKNNANNYGTNWSNLDLTSEYEKDLPILGSYNINTLLLEINCNVKEINEETIRKQFEEILKSKIDSCKEIFADNLKNITKEAKRIRRQQ